MKLVLDAIADRQGRLARLPFVQRLERKGDLEDALVFTPGLTFFAMVFQDILRVCEARMEAPALRTIVTQHRSEDKGHDLWFLSDMAKLGAEPDVRWLFGPEQEATRDRAYALISEVFRANSDYARLTLLWVLEASGEVFFSRVAEYMRTSGCTERLDYFSESHHAIERGHHLLETHLRKQFEAVELTPEVRSEALGVVGRGFDAFTAMFDDLESRIAASHRSASKHRARTASRGDGSSP
jgi:hypothetical protein